jgi:hypothetical protein
MTGPKTGGRSSPLGFANSWSEPLFRDSFRGRLPRSMITSELLTIRDLLLFNRHKRVYPEQSASLEPLLVARPLFGQDFGRQVAAQLTQPFYIGRP